LVLLGAEGPGAEEGASSRVPADIAEEDEVVEIVTPVVVAPAPGAREESNERNEETSEIRKEEHQMGPVLVSDEEAAQGAPVTPAPAAASPPAEEAVALTREQLAAHPTFADPASTYFLLYLNKHTFERGTVGGENLDDELLAAEMRWILGLPGGGRESGSPAGPCVKLIMVHEQDPEAGGCDFERFLSVTPKDLVMGGLYKKIAVALYPGEHAPISLAEICKAMGMDKHAKNMRGAKTFEGLTKRHSKVSPEVPPSSSPS